MRETLSRLITKGTPECAALCMLLGALTALLLLWLGIWKTLLVVACVSLGAFVGGVKHKKEALHTLWERFFGEYGR